MFIHGRAPLGRCLQQRHRIAGTSGLLDEGSYSSDAHQVKTGGANAGRIVLIVNGLSESRYKSPFPTPVKTPPCQIPPLPPIDPQTALTALRNIRSPNRPGDSQTFTFDPATANLPTYHRSVLQPPWTLLRDLNLNSCRNPPTAPVPRPVS